MKTLAIGCWLVAGTMAVIVENADVTALINVAAVAILGVIAWLARRCINSFDKLDRRQERQGKRMWILEFNMNKVCKKLGIDPLRYEPEDDSDRATEADE